MTGHAVLVGATASGKSALAWTSPGGTPPGSSCRWTRCRCTAAWTSAPPSPPPRSRPRCRTTCSTCSTRGRTAPSPGSSSRRGRRSRTSSSRGHRALLVGGTALYVQAIVDDLDIPGQYPEVRAVLESDADTVALHARLAELDPVAAGRMEPTNRRRIVRALEVTMGSGRPFSSYGPGLDAHPPTAFTLVGLRRASDDLRARIAARYAAADGGRLPRRGAAAPRRPSRPVPHRRPGARLQGAARAPGRRRAPSTRRSTSPSGAPVASPAASGRGSVATPASRWLDADPDVEPPTTSSTPLARRSVTGGSTARLCRCRRS